MRYGAIWVFDHLHDVRAVEPMIASLDSPPWDEAGVDMHHETIDALQNFGDFALEPLIAALHHENAYIRGNSAVTLRAFDDPRLPSLFIALAEHDPEDFVRLQATFALGKFASETVTRALERLTHDPDAEIRELATEFLGEGENKSELE
jgi:HEAT repeat protein